MMKTPSIRVALLAAAVMALSAGCDNPVKDGTPSKEPGLHVIAGANVMDTVQTIPLQALTVELIGEDGKPLPGVPVRFQSAILGGSADAGVPVYVRSMVGAEFFVLVHDTTDADGRAQARVRLGHAAGTGSVKVAAPTLGLETTASYTVNPGVAARVATTPQDTMLYTGRSVPIRVTVQDKHGNPRLDAPELRVLWGSASLAGTTVTASAIGRSMVVAQVGGVADTTMISVVPQGTIAAYTAVRHTGNVLGIYRLELDGSNLSLVTASVGGHYFGAMPAVWSVDGTKLFFHDHNSPHATQLHVYDLTTSSRRRLIPPGWEQEIEAWPRRSFDGRWVYYTGGPSWDWTIYRVRSDGTGRERFGPGRDPTLSPDGTRLAYINGTSLVVTTLATGQSVVVPGVAASPRWSPQGHEIGYIRVTEPQSGIGELRAARPDGTGSRAVTTSGIMYRQAFDYSPDGKYIIAVDRNLVITVIEAATGVELPITLRQLDHALLAPTWKP